MIPFWGPRRCDDCPNAGVPRATYQHPLCDACHDRRNWERSKARFEDPEFFLGEPRPVNAVGSSRLILQIGGVGSGVIYLDPRDLANMNRKGDGP